MKGIDYREYYVNQSIRDLIKDTSQYHQRIWPSIKHLIGIHCKWSTPIVIEGWALYPKLVKSIMCKDINKIWLVSDKDVLEKRLINRKDFYRGASCEDAMITKYLQRSIWHNEKIFNEVTEINDDYISVTKDLPEEEMVRKAIEILSKK